MASTRRSASPTERARDLLAAFADPTVGAILTTIGGEDQITLLRHLDPDVVRQHPKRFLGYSDNTNLLNWLWFHGVAGFHGGSTQVHLGPGRRSTQTLSPRCGPRCSEASWSSRRRRRSPRTRCCGTRRGP